MNDASRSLFDRYRALFSLRDSATVVAIEGIGRGLQLPQFSPLFKHELAFVLGELGPDAKPASEYLKAAIGETKNHAMVRHEAAEALGAVDFDPDAKAFLQQFLTHSDPVIRQSCEVALDIQDYWSASS
jgi:deoxyhypusine monooxygenase